MTGLHNLYKKYQYHNLMMKKHRKQRGKYYFIMLTKVFHGKKKNLNKFMEKKGQENDGFNTGDDIYEMP